MAYKHKVVFGTFQEVERQLDELKAKRVKVRSEISGRDEEIEAWVDVSPLGISFVPAMIQGGKGTSTLIPVCAVLTLQFVKDEENDSPNNGGSAEGAAK